MLVLCIYYLLFGCFEQVYQRIDVFSKDFDNIVEIELGAPWPLPPVEVTATLAHKFEITGLSRQKVIFCRFDFHIHV